MRAVCQRVSEASVRVKGEVVGSIDSGLLIFLGVGPDDTESVAKALAYKISGLRIFADSDDRMNLSVVDAAGACLVVSQFTLYGDCKKGRRPFFGGAASPELANGLCDVFTTALKEKVLRVETGVFGADMDVALHNDGPVTLILDSEDLGLS
jgi:D-tyrosyl-tRNA(Tyr) deacylase